jgi:hypothetical protein
VEENGYKNHSVVGNSREPEGSGKGSVHRLSRQQAEKGLSRALASLEKMVTKIGIIGVPFCKLDCMRCIISGPDDVFHDATALVGWSGFIGSPRFGLTDGLGRVEA